MNRKKSLGIVGGVLTLIVAVVGVSMVWASFTQNLVVRGSGNVKGSKWSIKFANLDGSSSYPGNYAFNSGPIGGEITGDTSIRVVGDLWDYGVSAEFTFDIVNDGDYNAKIDSGWTLPQPTCHLPDGASNTDNYLEKGCSNYSWNLVWDDTHEPIKAEDTLNAGQTRGAILTVSYDNDETDTSKLIGDGNAILIDNNFTIPFIQN